MTSLAPGQIVDRFRIDRTIHRGAQTDVFAATDLGRGAPVALRVMTTRAAADPGTRARFLEAARAGADLPELAHLARVRAWGQAGSVIYVVSDLVAGVGLTELLRRPNSVDASLLAQIADAVDAAHEAGGIHGRFGPDAVIVDLTAPEPSAVIEGFGCPAEPSPSDLASARQRDIEAFSRLCRMAIGATVPAESAEYIDAAGPFVSARAALAAWSSDSTSPRPRPPVVLPTRPSSAPRRRRVVPAVATAVALVAIVVALLTVTRRPASIDGALASNLGTREVSTVAPTTVVRRAPATTPRPATTAPAATTTTTTASTTTTIAEPTTTAPAVVEVGWHGFAPGEAVTEARDPSTAYVLALARRDDPRSMAPAGSPAAWYAQWARLVAPVAGSAPVVATLDGFTLNVDRPVTLRDFVVADGAVVSFSECRADGTCVSVAPEARPTAECTPGDGCPTVGSASGRVTAYQRLTGLWRWPQQILFYEVVPSSGTPAVATVVEPNDVVRFDPDTGYFVSVFADRPVPGTRHQLSVTFADGSSDALIVVY